jgi:hypothetical protein
MSEGEAGVAMARRRRVAGGEEKPKRLRRDAKQRRRDVGAEEKPKLYGEISSIDDARPDRGCGNVGVARP